MQLDDSVVEGHAHARDASSVADIEEAVALHLRRDLRLVILRLSVPNGAPDRRKFEPFADST